MKEPLAARGRWRSSASGSGRWGTASVRLGVMVVALFTAAAAAAPVLAPHDPERVSASHRLEGPSARYPLGTDHLGRCVLSRLLHGARWSLGTAGLCLIAILGVGIGVGAVAGYAGGVADTILMRVVDMLLAFPLLIPALAITGALGPGILHLVIGIVAVGWAVYARLVRSLVRSTRERPYVAAAYALGLGHARILGRHVLPNALPPVIVLASLELGDLVLTIAALNFVGLGVQPPTPELGALLNEGRPYLLRAPRLVVLPGLAITLLVLALNLVGEGLRDLADPRLRSRS